jgi:P4 family phage/plasmid primase-like protien
MRLVIGSEIAEGERIDEALIKTCTGDTDSIVARFMRENEFEFDPKFKIVLHGNHKPVIKDDTDGTWRRVHLWEHRVQIPETEQDEELKSKLLAELDDIFAWCAMGACELLQIGLKVGLRRPGDVEADTKAYRKQSDEIEIFTEQCCAMDDSDKRTRMFHKFTCAEEELYRVYLAFTEKRRGGPKGLQRFSELIHKKGFERGEDAYRRPAFFGIAPTLGYQARINSEQIYQ